MITLKKQLERILSIDWSRRVDNVYGFVGAMAVYIAWPFLPFQELHCLVYNVDLVGTVLPASACLAAALFMLGSGGWKAAWPLSNYITYALLVATLLIVASIGLSIRIIVVQGGVSLDIVLLFVALVTFMGEEGERGFWGSFFRQFFLVGIPLFFVDLYFGFAIVTTFNIPFDSLILGGGGLRDGLNKMFFMILAFTLIHNLLTTRRSQRIDDAGLEGRETDERAGEGIQGRQGGTEGDGPEKEERIDGAPCEQIANQ